MRKLLNLVEFSTLYHVLLPESGSRIVTSALQNVFSHRSLFKLPAQLLLNEYSIVGLTVSVI